MERMDAVVRSGVSAATTKARAQEDLALLIAWSAQAPHRVGEVALLSAQKPLYALGGDPDPVARLALGRERGQQLVFFRQRPLGVRDGERSPSTLAEQQVPMFPSRLLELRPLKHAVFVKNMGGHPIFVNGSKLWETPVVPGDTIYLEDRLVLYCSKRPPQLASLQKYPVENAPFFGLPDDSGLVGESPLVWAARECIAQAVGPCVDPPLSQRIEDLPLLVNHLLRVAAQRPDLDLSRFFCDGLPRIHPLLMVQLLRRGQALQLAGLSALLPRAVARSRGSVIEPLPSTDLEPARPRTSAPRT